MEKPWLAHYPAEVPESYDYPQVPLSTFLVESAEKHPERTAMWFYGRSTTYRQLLESANRFAGAVQGLGLNQGDRISIMLPNCPQCVIAYYGSLLAGLTVVPTNPMYTARELHHQLVDSGAKIIVTLDIMADRVKEGLKGSEVEYAVVTSIKDELPPMKSWLYPLQARRQGQHTHVDYDGHTMSWRHFMHHGRPKPTPISVDPLHDLALIQYTGGTTGTAKGVMLTHYNLVANAIQTRIWSYRLKEAREIYMAVLPFFHVFGMTAVMNQCVFLAGTLILVPKFQTREVLRLIHRFHPTAFPGTPTMYIALLRHDEVQTHDLSSIEVCISGAAPLPEEVQQHFERLTGGRLIEGYGLTEASPVTHANNLWGERRPGIGLPFPDTEAKIVDALGKPVGVGEIGELVVKGPQVMKGYWNRPNETASVLRDGWLYTGDMATMDDDGFFRIVDRKKDVIIAGGFNIYPREVEEVLYDHPAVEEAVVVGVPDDYRGETVKAFIALKPGKTATAEEITEWCRKNLAAFKVPRQYEFRDSLPKSAVGKVLRYKLVEETKVARPTGQDGDHKALDETESIGPGGNP